MIIIMSPMFSHACMHAGFALLYLALHRGLLPNLKGLCNQISGENENTETIFYTTGKQERENPQTEMREFHKLTFVTK